MSTVCWGFLCPTASCINIFILKLCRWSAIHYQFLCIYLQHPLEYSLPRIFLSDPFTRHKIIHFLLERVQYLTRRSAFPVCSSFPSSPCQQQCRREVSSSTVARDGQTSARAARRWMASAHRNLPTQCMTHRLSGRTVWSREVSSSSHHVSYC